MERIANRDELAAMFPAGGVGAELGVLDGLYSQVLWERARPARLHLVDTWQGIYPGKRIIDGVERDGIPGEWSLGQVRATFAGQIATASIVVHQADSVAWLASLPPNFLNWLYCDSLHTDHHLFRELCQGLRVVTRGGWLCGHDYSAAVPGVVSAVDRFCLFHGLTIDILTDEPEIAIHWRDSEPWQPKQCALNSFAIRVVK